MGRGLGRSALKMKMLVVLALFALVAAEPEAEAKANPYWGYYGTHGFGVGTYSGLGHHVGYGYPTTMWGHYGKREAEAEPKADPYWGYYGTHGVGVGTYHGVGVGAYHGIGHSVGYTYPYYNHFGKREAEAEPKADPYWGYYGSHGVGVGTYHGMGVGHYGSVVGYPYMGYTTGYIHG